MSPFRVLPLKPSKTKSSNANRDYGDLMEETEATSAAETNGVADQDDANMSSAEVTCVTQSEHANLLQQVRIPVANETLSSVEPCLMGIRNQIAPSSKTFSRPNRQVLRRQRPQSLPRPSQIPCLKPFSEQVCTGLLTAVAPGKQGQRTAC